MKSYKDGSHYAKKHVCRKPVPQRAKRPHKTDPFPYTVQHHYYHHAGTCPADSVPYPFARFINYRIVLEITKVVEKAQYTSIRNMPLRITFIT